MRWIAWKGIPAMALAAMAALADAGPAVAQVQAPPERSVTIYTDGIARPGGRITTALTELARTLSRKQDIRPLPVMGYGGVANVVDLLHTSGVDFAILNSDILAYLDIINSHADARQKIRLVTPLFAQKIYLLARSDIAALDQLAGRTLALVGPDSATEVTARTILALAGVDAEIVSHETAGGDGVLPEVDAVFFLQNDRDVLPGAVSAPGAFRLIPIPANDRLASVYRAATADAGEIPGLAAQASVATLVVDTVLAVYNWTPSHGRYRDVTRFIDRFFAALPRLREDFPRSIWNETDVHASVAGWRRHAHAEKAKASIPPPAPGAGKTATGSAPLRLSIVSNPPLTGPSLPGGGLIAELTRAVVKRATGGDVTLAWSRDRASQVEEIVAGRATSLAVPWETPHCDEPHTLGPHQAAICDAGLMSAPLFQVPVVFFTKAGSDFDFGSDDGVTGRVLCLHAGRDLADLDDENRQWLSSSRATLARPATLIDCLSMVERGEADAVVGSEAESRFAIDRLGLSGAFEMAERPLATRGIHIIVPKNRPDAEALLGKINQGIAELRDSDDYAAIIGKYLPHFVAGGITGAR